MAVLTPSPEFYQTAIHIWVAQTLSAFSQHRTVTNMVTKDTTDQQCSDKPATPFFYVAHADRLVTDLIEAYGTRHMTPHQFEWIHGSKMKMEVSYWATWP
jgi:hypothetical protein